MTNPFFHELKKQASFFLKEKIKTARLALTDVTPAELLTEEATNGNPWAPDSRTMGFISRAAFEIDDYWRIVEILHKRFEKFERKQWRESYNALLLLEHLLTHGPESVCDEFQSDRNVLKQMGTLQYIDEKGFNWGVTVRKKSERTLELLEKGPLLREERDRSRKVTRGIQGFGSFNHVWSSTANEEHASACYGRSNSHYEDSYIKEDEATEDQKENFKPDAGIIKAQMNKKIETKQNQNQKPPKENRDKRATEAEEEARIIDASPVLPMEESKPLLAGEEQEQKIEFYEEHPFNNLKHQMMGSKLLLNYA